MTDHLQHAIQLLETLPVAVQETVTEQIEQLAASLSLSRAARRSHAGIWADLLDDMEETLDRWRHGVPSIPFNEGADRSDSSLI